MLSKQLVLLLCGSLLTFSLFAQQLDISAMKQIKPRNIGPAGMSGRVTSIDVDLSNPQVIYTGTASGGVWKSTNGGINWKPVFDEQPVQSIGAVAVVQQQPDIIWVGTGEGNPRNSQNSGEGIYKSLDGGATWTCMGLKATKTIHRIIIHRDNPDIVFVAATGSAWGPNPERGVYRTTDGGKNWEKILYNNEQTGCADLVVDPTNPDKLIAAMWEYGRKPWTFNSGGSGSGLYVTHDGGDTWVQRTHKDGLPKGDLGRMGLAIAPSKPNIVYALVEAKENGLYKSTDGGRNWKKVNARGDYGNRPFYYSDIFVHPTNENRLFSLHSLVTKSEDGGNSWEVLLPYSGVHPDHHALWIHPTQPDYMIEGNDGGLNISRDGGANWRFVPNIPLAQFYHISYDMDWPYNVAGGMQDNGSWVGPSRVLQPGGIRNSHWQEVYFGDGFDVIFKPDDNRYVYAMSQGGNVGFVDRETGNRRTVKPTHPDADTELRFNWNAPIAQDPFSTCGLYFGSQFVHYSTDCGKSWELISPDLTTNDSSKQRQDISGGLTIDNTAAENHTTLLAIAPSPLDKNVIWVGSDDGRLHITRDRGQNWTDLSSRLPGMKAGSWIPYIEVNEYNAGEAFVIVNDYRRNNWEPMAFHTTDYGQSWTRIADSKQVHGHALSIVQDPEEPKLLWLGTDYGLYISIDKGQNWTQWTHGFPSAPTADMKIHPREHDLIIGTFGRAAWILDDIRPFREMARTGGKVLEQDLKVFTAPDAYQATYRSYDGVRFTADGSFQGENRRYGAMVTLWRKPAAKAEKAAEKMADEGKKKKKKGKEAQTDTTDEGDKEKKGKKMPEKAKVFIVDASGDTVRTFTHKLDTGLTRMYWGFEQDGIEYPSRRERKPDADPPSGRSVLPGAYKMIVQLGDVKDSTTINVKSDPRLDISMDDLKKRDEATQQFETIISKATKGFKQLQEARKTIKRVETAMHTAPDSLQKDIKKMGKALQDSIAQLEKLYMMPDGLKGIQRSSDNLQGLVWPTRSYLGDIEGDIHQPAQRMLDRLKNETDSVIEKVNAFFSSDFADYQKKVEEIQFSLFEAFEPIKE